MVALLLGLGCGVVLFGLIAALSVPLQRWADRTGYYAGKRQAPLGRQLQLIAFICLTTGLGTGFIYAGRVDGPRWLVVPGFMLFLVMISGAEILGSRLGRNAPHAPEKPEHARPPRGFFGKTLPRLALTYGRAFGGAVAMPPTGIVLIAVGKTWIGIGLLVVGVLLWIAMLRIQPKRRSPWPSS